MKFTWLFFVLGAALSWGAYVPMIHHGQIGMGKNSAFRAFLFVGIAYFVLAIVIPGVLLLIKTEPFEFTRKGVSLAFSAGLLGALGALCVIFALKTGGKPLYVAPLVFAGAPVVNVLVSMGWDKPKSPPGALFYVGVVLAATGVGMVLRYRPA